MSGDRNRTCSHFHDCVNMQPRELEEWLETDEAKSVGATDGPLNDE